MDNPSIFELPSARTNIYFEVVRKETLANDKKDLCDFIAGRTSSGGSAIVYVRKKSEAESICKYLNDNGVSALEYHKDKKAKERKTNQDRWLNN